MGQVLDARARDWAAFPDTVQDDGPIVGRSQGFPVRVLVHARAKPWNLLRPRKLK
jgi:hypothetical protein